MTPADAADELTPEALTEAAEAARRAGNPLRMLELVRGTAHRSPRLDYLEVLALAQMGETHAAAALYDARALDRNDPGEDVLALKGRLLKDRARGASPPERGRLLDRACDVYEDAYRRIGGYFPGINAASTALLAGREDRARQIARELVERADLRAPASYFEAATMAEAMLILDRIEAARDQLATAAAMPSADIGGRASTARQLAWLGAAKGLAADRIDALLAPIRPGPVLVFCGHRFREDSEGAPALDDAVRALLDRRDVTIAYGGLACGGDIAIAEALLARGGELHVILPYREADFLAVSVDPGGAGWRARFAGCMARATSITFASQMQWIGDDQQYAYGSRLAMGMALLRARQLETSALQLAIWDGEPPPAGAGAGTALDVATWRGLGGETATLPPNDLDRRMDADAAPVTLPAARVMKAIVFADFSGFSRLSEPQLPAFLSRVFGTIGAVLDEHRDDVACRNSWGDALFAIVDTPVAAAEIALEIQARLNPVVLEQAGLPPGGGLRISLHYGPIYADHDPIQGIATYYGTEVTLAARIEPRVPIGAIYATQSFAATLSTQAGHAIECSHVGFIDLAKGYGRRLIYLVHRRDTGASPALT